MFKYFKKRNMAEHINTKQTSDLSRKASEKIICTDPEMTQIPLVEITPRDTMLSLRGSKKRFSERIEYNLSSLSQRLPTPDLVCERFSVGSISKRKTVIVYLKNIANPGIVDEIKDRIKSIEARTGLGIDMADPGSGSKYKIVFVIPKPSKIKNISAETITTVHEIEADSLAQAVEKLQGRVSRQVTFTHLTVLLIGEKAAKNNFSHLVSFFRKSSELALRFGLQFVQNGQSKDIYTNEPQLDRSITAELVALAQQERYNSLVRTRNFQRFSQDLLSNKGVALGAKIYLANEDSKKVIVRGGGAVFKNWCLSGWLDDYETQAANWFVGKSQATVIGKLGATTFAYIVDDKSIKIKPVTKDGKLEFYVQLKTDGNIIEQQGSGFDLKKREDTKKLEKMFSETIKKQLVDAVYKSQKEFGADYLGFGRSLKNSDARLFKKLNWPKLFPEIPVTIEVDSHISRFGIGE